MFVLENIFLLFFAEFKYLMFHNNIVKISEKLNKRNLLKTCLQSYLPYRPLHNLLSVLLWEKWKYLIFFKSND